MASDCAPNRQPRKTSSSTRSFLSKYQPWSMDCKNYCKSPLVEVLAAATCISGSEPVKLPRSSCSGTTPIIYSINISNLNMHISVQMMSYCAYYNATILLVLSYF